MSTPELDTLRIEKLYKNFGVLADAKDKIGEHKAEYLEIISAVSGTSKEKRLASQFIARFFKHFPAHGEEAVEALVDLCEDEDVAIRKQAIKDLPTLCRDNKKFTHKVADILAQLLQAEDPTELSVVNTSLTTLFNADPKGTMTGLFAHVAGDDDAIRETCIKFLARARQFGRDVIDKDAEDFLIAQCKKVLQLKTGVNREEFQSLMEILGWSRLSQSISGQQELVDLAGEQAGITQPFDASDPDSENADKLVQCFRLALPYFSSQVDSTRFVRYFSEEVLPKLGELKRSSEQQLELLKVFAELCMHLTVLDEPTPVIQQVFKKVVEYIPVPDEGLEVEPCLEYSHIECLLYAYHRLLRECPETLTKDPDVLKDFRFRLQYLARGVQGYIKKLREALHGVSADQLKTDENKLKAIAFKTTSNINALIKDLFHTPPIFKTAVSLSWKPTVPAAAANSSAKKAASVSPGLKRHTPITFGGGDGSVPAPKSAKQDYNKSQREIYQPPSGKYSNKVSSYDLAQQRGGGGRFRGRGSNRRNFRGRGRRSF